jgi:hypothetical protein
MSILKHKHMSEIEAAPARPVEIFTGASRRRTWIIFRSIGRPRSTPDRASRSTVRRSPTVVGGAVWHLRPMHERLLEHIRSSTKIFAHETKAPVLDPGCGRSKTALGLCERRSALGRFARLLLVSRRRRFYELAAAGPAPIANEALARIGAL